jgi:hypothetical protein
MAHNVLLSNRLEQVRSPKDCPQEDKEMKDLVFKRIQLDRVDSSRQNEWLVDFMVRTSIGLLVTLIALFTFSANGLDTSTNKTPEAGNSAPFPSPGLAISPVSEAERFNQAWYAAHLKPAEPPDSGHNATLKRIPDTGRGIYTDPYRRMIEENSRLESATSGERVTFTERHWQRRH